MNIDGDSILTDEELLRRESALRWSTHVKRNACTSHDAWRHLNEGVVRRHYMLQASRLFLGQHCSPHRKEPLSVYEATECAIHLNAYYLNLRGTLDNLAWVLQYEWRLLADVTEDGGRRLHCYLFGQRFLEALQSRHAALASVLAQHRTKGTWLIFATRQPIAFRSTSRLPSPLLKSKWTSLTVFWPKQMSPSLSAVRDPSARFTLRRKRSLRSSRSWCFLPDKGGQCALFMGRYGLTTTSISRLPAQSSRRCDHGLSLPSPAANTLHRMPDDTWTQLLSQERWTPRQSQSHEAGGLSTGNIIQSY
jgi:hypothetical protein